MLQSIIITYIQPQCFYFLFPDQLVVFFLNFTHRKLNWKSQPCSMIETAQWSLSYCREGTWLVEQVLVKYNNGCIVVLSLQLNGQLPNWNSIPEQNPIPEQFCVFGGLQHALALCAFSLYCAVKFLFRIIRQCSKSLAINRGKQF